MKKQGLRKNGVRVICEAKNCSNWATYHLTCGYYCTKHKKRIIEQNLKLDKFFN